MYHDFCAWSTTREEHFFEIPENIKPETAKEQYVIVSRNFASNRS